MSEVMPIDLPLDTETQKELVRGERRMQGTARRTRKTLSKPWASVAAIVIAIIWTIPTFGLFVSSFRPQVLIQTTGWWTFFQNPQVTLENYIKVLDAGNTQLTMADAFINSIAITVPATIVPLTIAALAAYAFAWTDFKGRNILFVFVFALQIVPIQMALVPLLSSFSRGLNLFGLQVTGPLGVSGGYAQVWIAHSMFALPLAIYLLHNFMAEIPGEIIEAARVDGAVARSGLLPDRAAADDARHRLVRDLPVPVGVERPAGRARSSRTGRSRRSRSCSPRSPDRAATTGPC